jgi:ABC-type phosphate/phosphonate transport system substrate-binding protein
VAVSAVPWVFATPTASHPQSKSKLLRIGTSGNLASEKQGEKEESALKSLKSFVKEETGMDNAISKQKDWRELTDKMVKAELDLGVYQGYEFAWAQEQHPQLKPLALAVKVYLNPVAYVVTQKANKAKDFAGLQGQSVAIPATAERYLRLFVERQVKAAGKTLDTYFSKVLTPDNVEDALDDAVDGKVQAVVADRAALEAFKRRKPGRFNKLHEVAHSQPFPPPLVAYYGNVLDPASRAKFRKGLLYANRNERGQTMLTLFHLTGFALSPSDFDKVLAQTRKAYPPEPAGK